MITEGLQVERTNTSSAVVFSSEALTLFDGVVGIMRTLGSDTETVSRDTMTHSHPSSVFKGEETALIVNSTVGS